MYEVDQTEESCAGGLAQYADTKTADKYQKSISELFALADDLERKLSAVMYPEEPLPENEKQQMTELHSALDRVVSRYHKIINRIDI